MSECTHDCASCSENCAERDLRLPANAYSNIKHVIGVVSGKGGVGKSTVTAMLAVAAQSMGYQAAILDADVTGPSIPKMFGLHGRAEGSADGIFPMETKTGIRVMSVNLLLEKEDAPVIWRGPVISGMINQFWQDVIWGDVDYLFVDMPPGTGDVPLTVFQSLPIDGIFVVTTPQELVNLIVAKAYNMAKMMNVPVLGFVENMSWFECPDCKKRHAVFGESHLDAAAAQYGLPVLARLPIDPKNASLSDKGAMELADTDALAGALEELRKLG